MIGFASLAGGNKYFLWPSRTLGTFPLIFSSGSLSGLEKFSHTHILINILEYLKGTLLMSLGFSLMQLIPLFCEL